VIRASSMPVAIVDVCLRTFRLVIKTADQLTR
jgi:hypothetical protein